ncbi:MAG: 4a-hydroxytetrahydrobiopterin dehydratase [Planctomycetota bacterium]|nr:4a-hydroxytetrahydrobiopterin dehydratase [Planctomycetota bacterium]
MSDDLAARHCEPCRGGVPPMDAATSGTWLQRLQGWTCESGHHLQKRYATKDFASALAFVQRVAAVAEAEGHHPDLAFGWGWVQIKVWTHKVDGLTESDFVLAAKCDRVFKPAD